MIHESADVRTTKIGPNTNIWQYCVVLEGARIGCDCNINCHVLIESDVIVGNHVTIKSGVQIWDGVRIADNVFIGPNVTFTNDISPRSKRYPYQFKQTIVHKGASIGANSTIIAGNSIGRYALVGAGSLISNSVPDYTLWYGNPARMKGYVTKDGVVVGMDMMDKVGNSYSLVNGEPVQND